MRDSLQSEQRQVQELNARIAALERSVADEKQQAVVAIRTASSEKDTAVEAVKAQVCVIATVSWRRAAIAQRHPYLARP
jgi:hypothetical protein